MSPTRAPGGASILSDPPVRPTVGLAEIHPACEAVAVDVILGGVENLTAPAGLLLDGTPVVPPDSVSDAGGRDADVVQYVCGCPRGAAIVLHSHPYIGSIAAAENVARGNESDRLQSFGA